MAKVLEGHHNGDKAIILPEGPLSTCYGFLCFQPEMIPLRPLGTLGSVGVDAV